MNNNSSFVPISLPSTPPVFQLLYGPFSQLGPNTEGTKEIVILSSENTPIQHQTFAVCFLWCF